MNKPEISRYSNRAFFRAAQNVPPEVVRPPPNQQQAPEGKRQEEEERLPLPSKKEVRPHEGARECHGISLSRVESGRRAEDASPKKRSPGRGSRSDPVSLRLSRAEEDRSDETVRCEEGVLGARREGRLPSWWDQSHQGRYCERRLTWRRGVYYWANEYVVQTSLFRSPIISRQCWNCLINIFAHTI